MYILCVSVIFKVLFWGFNSSLLDTRRQLLYTCSKAAFILLLYLLVFCFLLFVGIFIFRDPRKIQDAALCDTALQDPV